MCVYMCVYMCFYGAGGNKLQTGRHLGDIACMCCIHTYSAALNSNSGDSATKLLNGGCMCVWNKQKHMQQIATPPLLQVSNLDDMRRFILEHSDFSRAQGNVTKHVNIVTQLSDVIGSRHLMDVSTVSWSE